MQGAAAAAPTTCVGCWLWGMVTVLAWRSMAFAKLTTFLQPSLQLASALREMKPSSSAVIRAPATLQSTGRARDGSSAQFHHKGATDQEGKPALLHGTRKVKLGDILAISVICHATQPLPCLSNAHGHALCPTPTLV